MEQKKKMKTLTRMSTKKLADEAKLDAQNVED